MDNAESFDPELEAWHGLSWRFFKPYWTVEDGCKWHVKHSSSKDSSAEKRSTTVVFVKNPWNSSPKRGRFQVGNTCLNQGHQLLVAHLVYLSSQAALALSRVDFFGAADDDLALIAALEASQADVRQGRLGTLPGIVKDVWVYSHP